MHFEVASLPLFCPQHPTSIAHRRGLLTVTVRPRVSLPLRMPYGLVKGAVIRMWVAARRGRFPRRHIGQFQDGISLLKNYPLEPHDQHNVRLAQCGDTCRLQ